MTTRAQVKINGDYDTIRTVAPTAAEKAPAYSNGHRWLETVDGKSYVLSDETAGTWTQIETGLDAKIETLLPGVYKRVLGECWAALSIQRHDALTDQPDTISTTDWWYLRTYVSVYADWTVSGASISVTDADDITGSVDDFEYADTAYVIGSRRNNGAYDVESVDTAGLTFGDMLNSGDDRFVVMMIDIPTDFDQVVGRMVWYDVELRNKRFGLTSEKIGSYSYNLDTVRVGGLQYPRDVASGIETYLSAGPIADAEYTP